MGDFPRDDRPRAPSSSTAPSASSSASSSARPACTSPPGTTTPRRSSPATIHPYRGAWLEFEIERSRTATSTSASASPASAGSSLSVLLGRSATSDEAFFDELRAALRLPRGASGPRRRARSPTREDALLEIYSEPAPASRRPTESARQYFENVFFNPKRYDLARVGRYKVNRKLGPEIERDRGHLGHQARAARTDQGTLAHQRDPGGLDLHAAPAPSTWATPRPATAIDDIDHFGNRRIRTRRRADPEPGPRRACPAWSASCASG